MSNFFDKTRVQSSALYNQAYSYVTNVFAQSGKIFTLSSAYGQILSVISNFTTMILYFIEDSITELNILTASRTQSVQGLARLAGHNATRAIAATGEISFSIANIPQIQGDQIIIPNFSRVSCNSNGYTYTLLLSQDQMYINTKSNTVYKASVIQGEIQVQFFTGDSTALQSYTVVTRGSVLIDNFYVNVYVNGVKWTKYDSLYDMAMGAQGYIVKTGISGGIDVYFGNGNFGSNPPTGSEIRIEYLLTSGISGNLTETENVTFSWIDSGLSIVGETVDLNQTLQTNMSNLITFGANPEQTAFTRLIAPRSSRSFALVNPDSYIIFLQKFNYFSFVDAYTTFNNQYIDDDNIIYLFLIPDITTRLINTENYFTIPLSYFTLTKQEQDKILNLIEDSGSKIVTTSVVIVDPIIARYVLNISILIYSGYSQDVITNTIIQNLSSYFLGVKRRTIIPASDIIRIVERIDGIDSVNINFLSEANENMQASLPGAPVVGLDNFGDIKIGLNELPVIRGGWTDRNGITYADGIYTDQPSSVNIHIKGVLQNDVNSQIFQNNIANIINNSSK